MARYKAKVKTQYISLEAQLDPAFTMLDMMGANHKKTTRAIMRSVGTYGKNYAKRKYTASGLSTGTGNLKRNITSRVLRNGKGVKIESMARSYGHTKEGAMFTSLQKSVYYGYALAAGATITAKQDNKPLTFKIGDKWIRTYAVKLNSHDFIERPVNTYLTSSEFKTKLNNRLQKEIDKYDVDANAK